ncbi:MAG: respiratory nitrate reductase subunit beta [Deltaproteobacteria bacterium]|nr:respiratory nitrate reductase subunit beta [Deltaproteobacteria bacterium]MBW2696569.1 respiratory nitrate reductase subunit beta [Deltaproteobacteria bacterium]
MTYSPAGKKSTLMWSRRQLATIIDLNKCLACQTCAVACKGLWTQHAGAEHMRFANVTTEPGAGYPRQWRDLGGGYEGARTRPGQLPCLADYGGGPRQFNHREATREGKGQSVHLQLLDADGQPPSWGYNWDEEVGAGDWPNPYYINLPRKCNHCSKPPCVDACPRGAIYKRESDGIVLIDQERCVGHRVCIEACPYKAIYWNPVTQKSEKCIECFPRVDQGIAPACNRQCVGRARHYGYLDDEQGAVYKLVKTWRIALPLHPEYGTSPNVYYVPPLSPQAFDGDGKLLDEMRIPLEQLAKLFGPKVSQALDTLQAEISKRRRGESSALIDLLVGREWSKRFGPFTGDPAHRPGEQEG